MATVYMGTTALSTTYGSATQLTAQIPAADIASAGINNITVQTPAPGGGTSNVFEFEVDSGSSGSGPTFTTLTASVAPGSTASYPVTLPSSATGVTVSCLNLPTGTSCSYSSGSVIIATSASTPAGTYQVTVVFTETLPGAASGLIVLPILLLPLAWARRRWMRQHIWITACLGFVILVGGAGIGCGGSSNSQTHTATSSGAVTLIVQYLHIVPGSRPGGRWFILLPRDNDAWRHGIDIIANLLNRFLKGQVIGASSIVKTLGRIRRFRMTRSQNEILLNAATQLAT